MRKNILDELFNEIKGSSELRRIENKMLLAQKIDMGVKAKGWNKSQFAKKMGQRPSVVTRWLSGTNNFNTDTLTDIEEILGINLLDTKINDTVVVGRYKVSSRSPRQESGLSKAFYNSMLLNSYSNTSVN